MLHWLSVAINTYLGHPLTGAGYQWWSGAGSDIGEVTVIGIALGWWRHHNCEERGCWRLGHAHPEHGRPVCRHHFHSPALVAAHE